MAEMFFETFYGLSVTNFALLGNEFFYIFFFLNQRYSSVAQNWVILTDMWFQITYNIT